jgi:hypothetical protein
MITKLLINLDKSLGTKHYKVELIERPKTINSGITPVLVPKLYSSKKIFHQWFAMHYKNLWCMYSFVTEQLHLHRRLYFKVSNQSFIEFSFWVWKHTDTQHYSVFK